MYRLLAVAFLCLNALFANAETLIPAEEYARLPQFSAPRISPDGLRIASTITYKGKPLLLVERLKVGEEPSDEVNSPLVPGKYFIDDYQWVNNDRLILKIRATGAVRGILVNYTRLLSISRDGTDCISLDMAPNRDGFYRMNPEVVCNLENDPDHVLATLDENPDEWLAPIVDKVNVYTGKKTTVLKNNRRFFDWMADNDGNIRIGIRFENKGFNNDITIFFRGTGEDTWEVLQKMDYFEENRLIPERFDDNDPNILLVSNQFQSEGDATDEEGGSLYTYDLTLRKVTGRYVDERRQKIDELVNRALPGKEIRYESWDQAKNRYVLRVFSDTSIPHYYLLDLQRQILTGLRSERLNFKNATFSPMKKVGYVARDGLKIPALLTLPVNLKEEKLPVVVFPHGGPWAHDEWGFDNYVQFFASRGYAVFQPQFRGSTGFGTAFEEAGYGQWGMKIQDDITDGVEWLIEQGIADPRRIAIVGGSFGGYAAAMGAAKTPELYKCAVSINGVLDLKYFFDCGRNYYFESIMRETWNDRSDVKSTSPYALAENVQAPMLLIAGEKDTVVPNTHSKRMYKKLKKLKKTVQYIELENGEHWRTDEENEIVVFKALEDFLGKYL